MKRFILLLAIFSVGCRPDAPSITEPEVVTSVDTVYLAPDTVYLEPPTTEPVDPLQSQICDIEGPHELKELEFTDARSIKGAFPDSAGVVLGWKANVRGSLTGPWNVIRSLNCTDWEIIGGTDGNGWFTHIDDNQFGVAWSFRVIHISTQIASNSVTITYRRE